MREWIDDGRLGRLASLRRSLADRARLLTPSSLVEFADRWLLPFSHLYNSLGLPRVDSGQST